MPNVMLFASNLHNPSHMEWTNDGRLLVSEHSAGQIKDITAGGNALNIPPFAFNLKGPAGILPRSDGSILVAETWGGTIRDIASGGDMSSTTPYSQNLSAPYSLVERELSGVPQVFVSEMYNGRDSWIDNITDGANPKRYVDEIPARPGAAGPTPLSSWPDEWQKFAGSGCVINWQDGKGSVHYIAVGSLGMILDVSSSGGKYFDLLINKKAIAWDLQRVGGIKLHPTNGLLYAVEPEAGNVIAINPSTPKSYRFEPPVIRGLTRPTCIRFSEDGLIMYVCGQGEGVIWKVTDFT